MLYIRILAQNFDPHSYDLKTYLTKRDKYQNMKLGFYKTGS
ncbi:MAG: hypothetical protein BAJALOKI2v1_20015 [Promethearchaeota archaeon]|nr:MAG: hypothetical protein BAJALOKI2v1_20015 [Candidatus Lokiarchaeota archaeon]